MLLAVFSDSHGAAAPMVNAVERYHPDMVLFLGDGVRDAEKVRLRFPEIPFTILRGNCDRDPGYEDRAILKLEGVGIFAAHGHEHGVKYGMDKFATSVLCSGSVLGLYGHTHRPLWQASQGIQLLNPGSIGSRQNPTFALVTLADGQAVCKILDAPKETENGVDVPEDEAGLIRIFYLSKGQLTTLFLNASHHHLCQAKIHIIFYIIFRG